MLNFARLLSMGRKSVLHSTLYYTKAPRKFRLRGAFFCLYTYVLFSFFLFNLATHDQIGNGGSHEHRGERTADNTQNHGE